MKKRTIRDIEVFVTSAILTTAFLFCLLITVAGIVDSHHSSHKPTPVQAESIGPPAPDLPKPCGDVRTPDCIEDIYWNTTIEDAWQS